ncbi:hypothetical protein BJ165DRAFT_1518151 [Panaeolus papilionaceus]|nr:hypothetical protein BJ165DRAFT_1518151 [Panaeolus papilionaceus]
MIHAGRSIQQPSASTSSKFSRLPSASTSSRFSRLHVYSDYPSINSFAVFLTFTMPPFKLTIPDKPKLSKPTNAALAKMEKIMSCVFPSNADKMGVPPYFNLYEGQIISVEAKNQKVWTVLVDEIRIAPDGFPWICGRYFYSAEDLQQYPSVFEAVNQHALIQELVIGQKLEVCGGGTIFGAANVKPYRDNIYVHPPIDFRKNFYRLSFNPGVKRGGPTTDQRSASQCSCCQKFYDWGTSHQRFCFSCNEWVHVQGLQPVDEEMAREQPARSLRELLPALSTIQVMRGRLCQVDENSDTERWSFVGTGLLRSQALALSADMHGHLTEEELRAELQQTVLDFDSLFEYIRTHQPSLYRCPLPDCTLHI